MNTKYSIGDELRVVDINGKVSRLVITSIASYSVAKRIGNVQILAQTYPSPNDTVDESTMFYICSSIAGDLPEFDSKILWDAIIDHDKTTYITTPHTYRVVITPLTITSGVASRSISEILTDVKLAISKEVTDASVTFEDITGTEESKLQEMTSAVDLALTYFEEIRELESIRPLINELLSIDFTSLTTGVKKYLAEISSRLSMLSPEGS